MIHSPRVISTLALLAAAVFPALAAASRYAILTANNRGWASERPLRYAHKDVDRLAETLKELGQFRPENIFITKGASPASIELAVTQANLKIQRDGSATQPVVLFYFSGHADETGLHPGADTLSYKDLKRLVATIGAAVRISLVDSCRSGNLTQLKGRPGPSFDIQADTLHDIHGDVFITSASANENAQESDRIQGSFFTHYVTSGLRGAADADQDGKVTLSEVYAFAYRMTVGTTSGTRGDTQHPAHRFDLRGRGEIILSYPGDAPACLVFDQSKPAQEYLVLANRQVVAEVITSTDKPVRLALPSGEYKVRKRERSGVFEQELQLLAYECRQVDRSRMERIILPETLSKGELLHQTWSVYIGYSAALGYLGVETLPRHNMLIALRIPLGKWALRPYFQYGSGSFDGDLLTVDSDLWAWGLAGTWDIATRYGLFAIGPAMDYQLLYQRPQPANSHWVSGLRLSALARWSIPIPIWQLAFGVEFRGGYAVHGLGGSPDHRPSADLGLGLEGWW